MKITPTQNSMISFTTALSPATVSQGDKLLFFKICLFGGCWKNAQLNATPSIWYTWELCFKARVSFTHVRLEHKKPPIAIVPDNSIGVMPLFISSQFLLAGGKERTITSATSKTQRITLQIPGGIHTAIHRLYKGHSEKIWRILNENGLKNLQLRCPCIHGGTIQYSVKYSDTIACWAFRNRNFLPLTSTLYRCKVRFSSSITYRRNSLFTFSSPVLQQVNLSHIS